MATPLDDSALDTIFRKARTQNKWFDRPVSREQLVALYDLMRWGPTSANCFPARIVFVTTPAAKERLKPPEGDRWSSSPNGAPGPFSFTVVLREKDDCIHFTCLKEEYHEI
jgi:nitroreductase